MKLFLKTQFQIVIQSILMTLVLFFIHKMILSNLLDKIFLVLELYSIYTFHFIVTSGIVFIISYKKFQGKDNMFNIFISFSILKMILVIVFLLPVFTSDIKVKNYDIFNFFIPYFIYLVFEIYSINQLFENK